MATLSLYFPLIFVGSIVIASAVNDLRVQKVPNLLTYPTMIGAITYHGLTNGLEGLLFSLSGLGLGTAVLLLPYLFGGMGAGDVKLMGASGAVLGMKGVFIAFLITALAGGIYALILVVANSKYSRVFLRNTLLSLKLTFLMQQFIPIDTPAREKRPKLCYAVFIAFGVLFYIFGELTGYNVVF
jgi:prepilin peptidase CpaA